MKTTGWLWLIGVLVAGMVAGCNPWPYPGEQGTILHVGLRQLPRSLDPPLIEDQASGQLASQVFEGLLVYHPFARPYRLEPGLALAMPEVSDDGLVYTFTLRKGVRFHDDPCCEPREVTADDFVWAYKRFAHPTTHAKGWWLFDGKLEGLNAWRERLQDDITAAREEGEAPGPLFGIEREVAGIQALDRYTIQFRLTQPYPQFLWVLAMPYTGVYPREAVEHYGDEFKNHPVGTGPFRMVSYNPVYRAILEANEGYRDVRVPDPKVAPWPGWEQEDPQVLAHAGDKIPLLDGMEVRFILEDQPRWLYFTNGFSDFTNPPKDNVAEALPVSGELSEELEDRGVRLDQWAELGTVYTCLNTLDPVLQNTDLRRAIALAFDHRWTVDNLYGGSAIVATSLIPPGVAGHRPDVHPYHADDGSAQLERAREMMVKAGYPEGIDPETGRNLRLVFEASGASATQRGFSNRFVDEMRRIGIEVDVVVNTFPQMIDKMRKGNFQVAGLAWGFDYPDAQNILQLLYGPNKAPGINRANFVHEEFDRLYDEAEVLPDGPERTAKYERMAQIVGEEVPWITRAHRIRPNLQHQWLSGFKYDEVSYRFWSFAGVDAELRREKTRVWNQPVYWPCLVFGAAFVVLLGVSVRRR